LSGRRVHSNAGHCPHRRMQLLIWLHIISLARYTCREITRRAARCRGAPPAVVARTHSLRHRTACADVVMLAGPRVEARLQPRTPL
jgi:hypothetical protein